MKHPVHLDGVELPAVSLAECLELLEPVDPLVDWDSDLHDAFGVVGHCFDSIGFGHDNGFDGIGYISGRWS